MFEKLNRSGMCSIPDHCKEGIPTLTGIQLKDVTGSQPYFKGI
jgi:hypothetical protein